MSKSPIPALQIPLFNWEKSVNTMNLSNKHCVPCEGGTKPLSGDELKKYLDQVPDWEIFDSNRKIEREFKFRDFKEAMVFVNKVADIAETEGHHPDVKIFYNIIKVELWTHSIGGLSVNDFVLAAKIQAIYNVKEE